ncbi:MAG: phage/plasmid primase, P4 family [Bacillota bacterium]
MNALDAKRKKIIDKLVEFQSMSDEQFNKQMKQDDLIKSIDIYNFKANASLFYQHQPFFYDNSSCFWFYDKTKYRYYMIDEVDVMNKIDDFFKFGNNTLVPAVRNSYLEALKRFGRQKIPKSPSINWIQFNDKVIDIITSDEFSASAEYFFTNPIPWDLGSEVDTPVMDSIFKDWVGSEWTANLYELLAFSMLPSYQISRMFLLVGEGSNGKSCYLRLLRRFVGKDNCTATDLKMILTSRFEVTKLYKKLVCEIGETDIDDLGQSAVIKKLTSGDDLVRYEIKGKNPFEDYNYAKLIISTNNIPECSDKSWGLYRRMLIILFPNEFNEGFDPVDLIPDVEYRNLCLKSIRIARDLLIKKEFSNEGSKKQRIDRFDEISNPLIKFLNEMIVEDENGFIFKHEFKKQLSDWCYERKIRQFSDTALGKKMKQMYKDGKQKAGWYTSDGSQPYLHAWFGLRWKEDKKYANK